MGRLIFFLIIIFIVYYFYKKIKIFKQVFNNINQSNNTQKIKKMLKDPQCGTYVSEETNFKIKFKGNDYFFCSQKCKEDFLKDNT